MTSLLRRSERKVEMVSDVCLFGRFVSLILATKEDMFGANDEDWAIYRKIVCTVASRL
jgi:hypothetical protein